MNGSRRIRNIFRQPHSIAEASCVMYREEQKQLAAARMRRLSHASIDWINKEMLTLGTNLIRIV
jgi:hypothetical protein